MKIIALVKPNAKKNVVKEIDMHHFKIQTKSPATEGKANMACIQLLSKHLQIPQSHITLKSGATTKKKVFEIS
jgi:uncharacterized protein